MLQITKLSYWRGAMLLNGATKEHNLLASSRFGVTRLIVYVCIDMEITMKAGRMQVNRVVANKKFRVFFFREVLGRDFLTYDNVNGQ